MDIYENQRLSQAFRKGKHFLFRMRHPSWCPLCRIKEWNVLMTTIWWPTDVISHGSHWDTIRDCQMMVTTKKLLKCWYQSSFYVNVLLYCITFFNFGYEITRLKSPVFPFSYTISMFCLVSLVFTHHLIKAQQFTFYKYLANSCVYCNM